MSQIKRVGGHPNAVIVQLPERQNPGVVIQGDSIQNLMSLITDAKSRIVKNDWDELRDIIDEIDCLIKGYAAAFSPD